MVSDKNMHLENCHHSSQLTENDASELEPDQLELPILADGVIAFAPFQKVLFA